MSRLEAREVAQVANPISRIARVFNPQLVKNEDRVSWLDNRLKSLARHREHAMKTGLGYRGFRVRKGAADPSITLDLGKDVKISSIYLVPAQREFLEDPGIFPKRLTLELSSHEDFSQRTILYSSTTFETGGADGNPVQFKANDVARYVRLTVQEGHNKGMLDLFGLSEIAVISNLDPVSFGAKVTTTGDLSAQGIWYSEALVDGRTPLGVWQNGPNVADAEGESVAVSDSKEFVTWTLDFVQTTPLDRVILYPYQLDQSYESSVFPDSMKVELLDENGINAGFTYDWKNPLADSSSMTPLVIPLHGESGKTLRVTGTRPCVMGGFKVHALSEIEIWSNGKNIAQGLPVTRTYDGNDVYVNALTDGLGPEKQIIPVSVWLDQLSERSRVEKELHILRPIHAQHTSESELNAAWGQLWF